MPGNPSTQRLVILRLTCTSRATWATIVTPEDEERAVESPRSIEERLCDKGTALPMLRTLASKTPKTRDSFVYVAQFVFLTVALGSKYSC